MGIELETSNIIKSCKNKDPDAFRILVDRYSEYAFSVAFRIINDEEESNDIVQESFIAVWNKIGGFNINRNFTNWFYRIVINKCYDSLRRKNRRQVIRPEPDNWNIPGLYSDSDTEKKLDNKEMGRVIRILTNKLSVKQKIVFVLSELEGFTHDDISDITRMTKPSIKSNLNHARRNIGKMLQKYI
jgi:RNA polymerase sigma-70 factor (ECF subfamily)